MNAPLSDLTLPRKARLRVDDFLLLNASGAFADYSKSELIDGEVYVVNSQFSRHAQAKSLLSLELGIRLREIGSKLQVWIEASVRLSDHDVPEPDLVLTSHRPTGTGLVPLETVALVVEVSDTSLQIDLGRKLSLYAAAGVPEYWVLDVNGKRILRYDRPGPTGYEVQFEIPLGAPIASATIEGLEIVTTALTDPT